MAAKKAKKKTAKRKAIRRTPEQRKLLVKKINGMRADGMSREKACKAAGVAPGSYDNWKAKATGPAKKRSTKRAGETKPVGTTITLDVADLLVRIPTATLLAEVGRRASA